MINHGVNMKKLVYDLPTRFFHWLFAGLFLISFIIAKTVSDETVWFGFHAISGLTLSFLVLLRIIWGFFGTQHARFSGFALNPMDLINYFKGIKNGDKKTWSGHNPASSWAGIAMMLFAIGLGITGYLMTSGPNKENFEDFHEILAYAFLITVILHVAGIILHTVRHKEMIGLSMITGEKSNIPADQAIKSSQYVFGIILLVLVFSFGYHLVKNYDQQNFSLQFFGTKLQLGENETNKDGNDIENHAQQIENKDTTEKKDDEVDDD